ncbi:zinc finger protein 431-like isoform X2 [Meriones unguiculatus]|uniref:zinc finger protein 431-like isoform X2 n=1 Tax=Meriones unguiculatus TaxID=10047 RepID=UPI00293EB781|nr:zinc finger protein 431-like isoform X2 [Meriones unguiculatus]XP_060232148.1 zinc finger protein 431-like isoform X2 [Meriones unguiculatus]
MGPKEDRNMDWLLPCQATIGKIIVLKNIVRDLEDMYENGHSGDKPSEDTQYHEVFAHHSSPHTYKSINTGEDYYA